MPRESLHSLGEPLYRHLLVERLSQDFGGVAHFQTERTHGGVAWRVDDVEPRVQEQSRRAELVEILSGGAVNPVIVAVVAGLVGFWELPWNGAGPEHQPTLLNSNMHNIEAQRSVTRICRVDTAAGCFCVFG